jgi:2-polyprenyl-6-methoxyphenol hydroxylase-like FAD-dependent oxidoreductase
MERCLRQVISSQSESELRTGSTITAIEETKEEVIVTYMTSAGELTKLRAKFLVGADGKTGFTRKKYLEAKGITMEKDEK